MNGLQKLASKGTVISRILNKKKCLTSIDGDMIKWMEFYPKYKKLMESGQVRDKLVTPISGRIWNGHLRKSVGKINSK